MSRHSTDIVGYTFDASIFCPACIGDRVGRYSGVTAEERLDNAADWLGIKREDETSFDSCVFGDWGVPNDKAFPKVVFDSQLEGDETCENCGESLTETITGTDVLPGVEPQD